MADNEFNDLTSDENLIQQESTEDVTDKKCPNCGATVVYNPETLGMTCDFCGYHRELPRPEDGGSIQELDFASAINRESCDWGTKKKSVVCQNCGGESIYDDVDTASSCPFCGSTSVMPVEGIEGVMSPGGVVPFAISKEKAAELFKKWIKGKIFCPSRAKKESSAKYFDGIYLPYWTYDTDTTSSYSARLGYEYRDGDKVRVRWKSCSGVYQEFIDDQLVYASKKTANADIERVSKFEFKDLREYSPELVAGFAAQRYSMGLDEGWEKAKILIDKVLKDHLSKKLRSKYNADRVDSIRLATSFDKITYKYILAPIWMSNFKYNDEVYSFVVNGQTGKISGKSPISPWRVAIAVLIAIVILGIVFYFEM